LRSTAATGTNWSSTVAKSHSTQNAPAMVLSAMP
jgi:hypothetical protein